MSTPNPVIEAVDEGHFTVVVPGKGALCRADAEGWPCEVIRYARVRLRERAAHRAIADAAKKARER